MIYSPKAIAILRTIQAQECNPYQPTTNNDTNMDLPTDLEDPTAYTIFSSRFDQVLRTAKTYINGFPENICIGTTNSLSPGARVITISENIEYLIIFNRSLIPFCLLFSGFLAKNLCPPQTPVLDGSPFFNNHLILNWENEKLLYQIICSSIKRVESRYDQDGNLILIAMDQLGRNPYLYLTPNEKLYREIILSSIESFIIAHELAHIIISNTPINVNFHQDWEQYYVEHKADELGSDIGFRSSISLWPNLPNEITYPLCIAGGIFFLACIQLIEKAEYVLHNGTDIIETIPDIYKERPQSNPSHPMPFLRIKELQRRIAKTIDPRVNTTSIKHLDAANHTCMLFTQCWPKIRKIFYEHYIQLPLNKI